MKGDKTSKDIQVLLHLSIMISFYSSSHGCIRVLKDKVMTHQAVFKTEVVQISCTGTDVVYSNIFTFHVFVCLTGTMLINQQQNDCKRARVTCTGSFPSVVPGLKLK